MKTAIQQAAELYSAHGLILAKDLEHYIKYGYVFVTPDRMMLARSFDTKVGISHWPDNPAEGDAWFVNLAIGKGCVPWFLAQMPFRKPYVAWSRDFKEKTARLRIFTTERVLKKFNTTYHGL